MPTTKSLSLEPIQFLKELQAELQTQEMDGQAAPRFWSILNYRYVAAHPGTHDRVSLYFTDACESVAIETYVKDVLAKEKEFEVNEEALEELKEVSEDAFSNEEAILRWIEEYHTTEVELVYEQLESFVAPDAFFLTKKEAQDHLQQNHYHYHEKAHTYAMTAWRAPKVERLWKILEEFDWNAIMPKE